MIATPAILAGLTGGLIGTAGFLAVLLANRDRGAIKPARLAKSWTLASDKESARDLCRKAALNIGAHVVYESAAPATMVAQTGMNIRTFGGNLVFCFTQPSPALTEVSLGVSQRYGATTFDWGQSRLLLRKFGAQLLGGTRATR